MKTIEYLDAIRQRLDLPSDYALAKALGVTRQAVSKYRSGNGAFDDEVSKRAADLLKMHPAIVMLDMHAERASTPENRDLWKEITKGFWRVVPPANDRRRMPRPV